VQSRSQYEGVVMPGAGISKLTDLKGKKVGIPQLGATLETYVNAVLVDGGLSGSDVKYVATGIGAPMGEALRRARSTRPSPPAASSAHC
jgi:NitT/TauT family transport system substrate-binding protein